MKIGALSLSKFDKKIKKQENQDKAKRPLPLV